MRRMHESLEATKLQAETRKIARELKAQGLDWEAMKGFFMRETIMGFFMEDTNQTRVGKALGISRNTVNRVLRGRSSR